MTLTQIQDAVGDLPVAQKQELFQFLRQQLQAMRPMGPSLGSVDRQKWLDDLRRTAETLKTGVVGEDLQSIFDELRADR